MPEVNKYSEEEIIAYSGEAKLQIILGNEDAAGWFAEGAAHNARLIYPELKEEDNAPSL